MNFFELKQQRKSNSLRFILIRFNFCLKKDQHKCRQAFV